MPDTQEITDEFDDLATVEIPSFTPSLPNVPSWFTLEPTAAQAGPFVRRFANWVKSQTPKEVSLDTAFTASLTDCPITAWQATTGIDSESRTVVTIPVTGRLTAEKFEKGLPCCSEKDRNEIQSAFANTGFNPECEDHVSASQIFWEDVTGGSSLRFIIKGDKATVTGMSSEQVANELKMRVDRQVWPEDITAKSVGFIQIVH